MSRLITGSLFGSISWAKNSPPHWRERAYQSLEDMLARVWNDPNEAAQRGMDFEKTAYSILGSKANNIEALSCSDHFKKILNLCKGGQFQKKTKSFIEIAGEEYCLYGKIDVWFEKLIIDIKTTGNYKGRDNYLKSMQHKIYCYCEGISDFQYVIAEFTDSSGNTIKEVHIVDYHIDNPKDLKEEITDEIINALTFLEADPKLMDLFLTKYSMY